MFALSVVGCDHVVRQESLVLSLELGGLRRVSVVRDELSKSAPLFPSEHELGVVPAEEVEVLAAVSVGQELVQSRAIFRGRKLPFASHPQLCCSASSRHDKVGLHDDLLHNALQLSNAISPQKCSQWVVVADASMRNASPVGRERDVEGVLDAQGCTRREVAEGDVGAIADVGRVGSEKNTLRGHVSLCCSLGLRNRPNRPVNVAASSNRTKEVVRSLKSEVTPKV